LNKEADKIPLQSTIERFEVLLLRVKC